MSLSIDDHIKISYHICIAWINAQEDLYCSNMPMNLMELCTRFYEMIVFTKKEDNFTHKTNMTIVV